MRLNNGNCAISSIQIDMRIYTAVERPKHRILSGIIHCAISSYRHNLSSKLQLGLLLFFSECISPQSDCAVACPLGRTLAIQTVRRTV